MSKEGVDFDSYTKSGLHICGLKANIDPNTWHKSYQKEPEWLGELW